MTRPAASSAAGSRGRPARRAAGARRRRPGSPASRSSSCSPTHRIGAEPGVHGTAELPADQLVGLARVAPALGVADDDPGRPARRASARRSRRCRRPGSSWWTFCAPMPTSGSVSARASRTTARLTNGGQMTRVTPGHPRPRRDRPREVAGVGRGRVHLPVGGHDHVTHRRNHARAGRAGTAGSASMRREALEPLEGPLDRGSVDLEAFGQLGQARLGCRAARIRHAPDDVRLGRQAPVGVERRDRIQLAARGADRALEVGRLRVEHPVELTAQGPRDLPRLDLEQGPGRADPAQEGPDRLAVLGRDDAPAASEPPRHRQAELGQPDGELGSLGGLHDELEVGPPAGEAERAAGEEPAAQPGAPAMLRRRPPRRTWSRAAPRPGVASRWTSRPTDASRPLGAGPRPSTSATRSHGRDGSMAASSSRRAVTRSRSERPTSGGPGRGPGAGCVAGSRPRVRARA